MTWDRIEGNWKQLKGKVQEKWDKLTNDDIDVVAGKRERLAGNNGKDEVSRQIEEFTDSVHEVVNSGSRETPERVTGS